MREILVLERKLGIQIHGQDAGAPVPASPAPAAPPPPAEEYAPDVGPRQARALEMIKKAKAERVAPSAAASPPPAPVAPAPPAPAPRVAVSPPQQPVVPKAPAGGASSPVAALQEAVERLEASPDLAGLSGAEREALLGSLLRAMTTVHQEMSGAAATAAAAPSMTPGPAPAPAPAPAPPPAPPPASPVQAPAAKGGIVSSKRYAGLPTPSPASAATPPPAARPPPDAPPSTPRSGSPRAYTGVSPVSKKAAYYVAGMENMTPAECARPTRRPSAHTTASMRVHGGLIPRLPHPHDCQVPREPGREVAGAHREAACQPRPRPGQAGWRLQELPRQGARVGSR